MKQTVLFFLAALLLSSCSRVSKLFSTDKTPHEIYAEKIEDRGLDKTPQGRAWLAAAEASLKQPVMVKLPYSQQGYFPADKPRALALRFRLKRGLKANFNLNRSGASGLPIYADLFRVNADGSSNRIMSVDTTSRNFSIEVDETGDYLLRLQPEMGGAAAYSLRLTTGPSLDFPVASSKAYVGSVWGDNRDGGKRNHEGIDIFAKKGTPVLAVRDGTITGVKEGGLGGKVVWLHPDGADYYLYHAHLDKQLVHAGQIVHKGDTLGLVGNTGNARTTPSHLHFGVYTSSGPIDPLPFVDRKEQLPVAAPSRKLDQKLMVTKTNGSLKARSIVVPVASTASGYLVETAEGAFVSLPFESAKSVG